MKWLMIISLPTLIMSSGMNDILTGCSSHCSASNDKNLDCFNKTLKYFEDRVFGLMRNYVGTQIIINKLPNRMPRTADQMIQQTIAVMKTVTPPNIQDEQNIMNGDQVRPIVTALVSNAIQSNITSPIISCPIGCESGISPWLLLFSISAACNILLLIIATIAVVIISRRDEQASAKLLASEMAQAAIIHKTTSIQE